MKKYFIGLEWRDDCKPIMHLQNVVDNLDEYTIIPKHLNLEKKKLKKCAGAMNPLTGEYISCDKIIDEKQTQCYECMHTFDFYNCVRCHGGECNARNCDVVDYCNTPHYVYLAYFSKDKIKVGTASEIRKYDRLLEQGALYSVFIAKTPTGKIARQMEKCISDSGMPSMVTAIFKMKNIILDGNFIEIKKRLLEKYQIVLRIMNDEMSKYIIEPEFNHFDAIRNDVESNIMVKTCQMDLFGMELNKIKPYTISKLNDYVIGDFLFAIGKIIAIEKDGIVKLYDTKKMEGFLFEFEM